MIVVGEASNGREAIQQFRMHHPDVTLMDLQMPEMNGLDALIAIRNEFPDAKVIVLTTYAGDAQILRALKAGAQAYLLKNTLHKELLETIRTVHAGKKSLSPEVSYQIAEHATDDTLTPAEISVLRLIAAGQCEQANCGSALHHGGNGQEPSQVHPFEIGRQRPNARRNDRLEERNHRTVVVFTGLCLLATLSSKLERVTILTLFGVSIPRWTGSIVMSGKVRFATLIFNIRWRLAWHRVASHALGCRLRTNCARELDALERPSDNHDNNCRTFIGIRNSSDSRPMDAHSGNLSCFG